MSQFTLLYLILAIPAQLLAGTTLSDFLRVSDPMLGTPYQFDPRGDVIEGNFSQPGAMSRPVHTSESTDCLVFVNDVLSMLHANTLSEVDEIRLSLYYKKEPHHWFNRNHFTETDWLKAIQPYQTAYAPLNKTKLITQAHNARQWWKKNLQTHANSKLSAEQKLAFKTNIEQNYPKTVTLRYWPWDTLMRNGKLDNSNNLLQKHGWAVVLFVRKDWPSPEVSPTPLLISHMGFLWNNKGQIMLRHARLRDKVVDVPFEDYIQDKIDTPSWAGIIILHPKLKASTPSQV